MDTTENTKTIENIALCMMSIRRQFNENAANDLIAKVNWDAMSSRDAAEYYDHLRRMPQFAVDSVNSQHTDLERI